MKSFYLVAANGQIQCAGQCPDADFVLQNQPGLTLMEGVARPLTQYFNGVGLAEIPAKPSANHVFNWQAKQWDDPRTLDDFKAAKWTDIKRAREAALAAPLQTAYGTFDATPTASANIIKSVMLANNLSAMGQPVAIDFTLANNTVVTLDAAAMIAVGLTLAGREQTIRAKATTLRAQIEAATTQAQVEAVVW